MQRIEARIHDDLAYPCSPADDLLPGGGGQALTTFDDVEARAGRLLNLVELELGGPVRGVSARRS